VVQPFVVIKVVKYSGHIRWIRHPKLGDERPVIVDDDKDAPIIMLAKLMKYEILIRRMWNP
jgi:hypothetical protein